MPGNIRVAVLEAVDLPATVTAGKSVAVKVAVGKKEFQTTPAEPQDGRTQPWNSEFLFPVLNLRDNLIVGIMDSKGDVVARAEIETPGIVQKGFQDAFIALKAGGRIHMKVSFVLSEEERRKIEAMRLAAMKRRKGGNQQFRSRQSTVKITEITSEEEANSKLDTIDEHPKASPVKPTPEATPGAKIEPRNVAERSHDLPSVNSKPVSKPLAAETEKIKHPAAPTNETAENKQSAQNEGSVGSAPGCERKPVATSSNRKVLNWLAGRQRGERLDLERSKAVESGRWLDDMKLRSKNDKYKAAKAAKADEWIKRLDSRRKLPAPVQGDDRKQNTTEDLFKQDGSRLRKHLQDEEKRLKSLGQKSTLNSDTVKISHRTVKQKLEDWRLKELGPWRRSSSKVRHASPPGSDHATKGTGWILKPGRKGEEEEKKHAANQTSVAIEQPDLMTAADKLWASSVHQDYALGCDSSPSSSPESRKKGSKGVKTFVKQVMTGAAVVAGAFIVWPRKGSSKKKERYHVVQEGETLSSIVPGEWEDPESNFYRLNPEVCNKHFIYPGQRLRLS